MEGITTNNNIGKNSKPFNLRNTHCIVCGDAFSYPRVGKVYCSAKCKQYGFNHKESFDGPLEDLLSGTKQKSYTFYLNDFVNYKQNQKKLKRYGELSTRDNLWKAAEAEIEFRNQNGLQIKNYTWDIFGSKRLSESEEFEASGLLELFPSGSNALRCLFSNYS